MEQVLVKWIGLDDDDATWLDVTDVQQQFPDLSLVVKAVSERAAVDRPEIQVYLRRHAQTVILISNELFMFSVSI